MFNEAYFERGLETGVSCYQNYRWIPELTIPMAMTIIDWLGIERGARVLDFGCAKGFLVKALRLLYRDAWGVDISEYAIRNCDPSVRGRCFLADNWIDPFVFDYCIVKDVLEHIKASELPPTLEKIKAERLLVVVPLGSNGHGYRAPVNDCDITHVTCEDEDWWQRLFEEQCRVKVEDFRFRIHGIKDSYYESYPQAHGFFTLSKEIA